MEKCIKIRYIQISFSSQRLPGGDSKIKNQSPYPSLWKTKNRLSYKTFHLSVFPCPKYKEMLIQEVMLSHTLHPCVSLCVSDSICLQTYVYSPFFSCSVTSVPPTNKYNDTILQLLNVKIQVRTFIGQVYWLTTNVYLSN